jgi:hypothetical protein
MCTLRVANPHTCASMTLSAALHGLDRPGARVLSHTLECNGMSIVRNVQKKQLSTTDLLALASMKNAAKCDK